MTATFAVCTTTIAWAQTPANDPETGLVDALSQPGAQLALYWENDGGYHVPGGTDRHYTNGFGFSLAGPTAWADHAAQWMLFGQSHRRQEAKSAAGVLVGHEMYTPDNIRLSVPDPSDWPYAGYLYGGFFLQRQAPVQSAGIDAVFDHVQLDVGMVGPSTQADELQRSVHELIDSDDPKGWSHQLDDEPTAQLTYRRKWRADLIGGPRNPGNPESSGDGTALQLIPRLEARLGTVHVDATVGAMMRYGLNLADDFGPGFLHDPAAATAYLPERGWTIYGFADASARVVAHNIFLDGGVFQDGPSIDKEPVVGRVTGGVSAGYRFANGNRIAVNYALWAETSQAQTQSSGDTGGLFSLTAQWFFD